MVSASEIEKFAYCPMTWWLSRSEGEEAEKAAKEVLAKGTETHREHAEKASHIKTLEEKVKSSEATVLAWSLAATFCAVMGVIALLKGVLLSRIVVAIALVWLLAALYALYRSLYAQEKRRREYERSFVILAIFATVASISGVEFLLPEDLLLGRVLETIAIAWLMGAVMFLYRGLIHEHFAIAEKEKVSIDKRSEIAYVDANVGEGELLSSEKYGLRGRPDLVLKEGEEIVPLEKKTGRVPRGPLFSHIAQIGVYCIILEERYGSNVTHGIVQYNDTKFTLDYDENLKNTILGLAEKIRSAEMSTKDPPVHRNHNRPGKCIGCSRRDACNERLE
jgi:CRISPR-associated exonuclease Cas4